MSAAAVVNKGAATREAVIERALSIVRTDGFEGLTIGGIASAVGMSKSGVFAHFGSREDLQLAVLDAAAQSFTENVFVPAIREKRGLPRLRAIMRHWVVWLRSARGGCPMVSAAVEYDDRPGPIRDRVVEYQTKLRRELARAVRMAIDAGEMKPDCDADQLAFEIFAIELALHHDSRLFKPADAMVRAEKSMQRLLDSYRV
ncbi:MAG TPA: TetR/AcrR family transcriptional regulator [Rudaea sp.]|jgi:AcrR family transcriptional regulator|nr:TetR/AcrR family transcriptional regulator [Rudaea sp.]